MKRVVQWADRQLSGPVELHLTGQVAGRAATNPHQVVGGGGPAHQRPYGPVGVYEAHAFPVAQEDASVNRHGDALYIRVNFCMCYKG
jgi:hypothetical protein